MDKEHQMNQQVVKLNGFMAGLLQTRKGLAFHEDDERRVQEGDPFLIAYAQGEKCRNEIVLEALNLAKPELSSRDRLMALVAEGEKLIEGFASGSFDDDPFRVELARALVHLADTEGTE